jgi:tRNA(adenine34) deaminase
MKTYRITRTCLLLLMVTAYLVSCRQLDAPSGLNPVSALDLAEIRQLIETYRPDPNYTDDRFILITVEEALAGGQERNGGVGACLVNKVTGEILERSHNRQYEPWFRSDLHAEMDLLNRYEDRIRAVRSTDPNNPRYRNPRDMANIVLYTSVEPCPMCLGRIINAGIKEVYYATADEEGGMGRRFADLPSSWKAMAGTMIIEPARCSPTLHAMAVRLFRPMYAAGMHRH